MKYSDDLEALKIRVEDELNNYSYSFSSEAIGRPWSSARVAEQLDLMRRSLVVPYVIEVKMDQPFNLIGTDIYEVRHCAVVADANDGYLLVFDYATNEFFLGQFFKDTVHSIGVKGDAVGCFMSR